MCITKLNWSFTVDSMSQVMERIVMLTIFRSQLTQEIIKQVDIEVRFDWEFETR